MSPLDEKVKNLDKILDSAEMEKDLWSKFQLLFLRKGWLELELG
jgi:hypothetical protein